MRALGITSVTRTPRYPDLPAISETIPGFEMVAWYGLFAPNGTWPEAMARLRDEIGRFLALPDAQPKINANGPEVWISAPEQF
ncbi:MAG: hypothetical protein EXR27_20730 [Betaproteobacteria bacterium]|nr:hypothetical protein [Betaproteobacteria bacterium]